MSATGIEYRVREEIQALTTMLAAYEKQIILRRLNAECACQLKNEAANVRDLLLSRRISLAVVIYNRGESRHV